MHKSTATAVLVCLLGPAAAAAAPLDDLLARYAESAEQSFDASRGGQLWRREIDAGKGPRSCSLCHGKDLTRSGRHQRTRKPIEPLAPRANPQRLTDIADIEKWLKRNCRWTWGRDCTAQERGDLLSYLRDY